MTTDVVVRRKISELENVRDAAAQLRGLIKELNKVKRTEETRLAGHTCDFIHNMVQSAIEMANGGDLESDEIPGIKKNCMSKLLEIKKALEISAQESKQNEERTVEERAAREANTVRDLISNSQEIKKLATWKSHLPKAAHSLGDKKTVLFKMPVVVLLNFPVGSDRLEDVGMSLTMVGGYPVFFDQTIIGLNVAKIEQDDYEKEAFLESTLKALSKRLGTKMTVVADPIAHHSASGLSFYWVMPDRELGRLQKIIQTKNNQLSIKEWGFPF
jgi:hypothetical protein